jgi:hypothetical protein
MKLPTSGWRGWLVSYVLILAMLIGGGVLATLIAWLFDVTSAALLICFEAGVMLVMLSYVGFKRSRRK